jgi:hypothetical protein
MVGSVSIDDVLAEVIAVAVERLCPGSRRPNGAILLRKRERGCWTLSAGGSNWRLEAYRGSH